MKRTAFDVSPRTPHTRKETSLVRVYDCCARSGLHGVDGSRWQSGRHCFASLTTQVFSRDRVVAAILSGRTDCTDCCVLSVAEMAGATAQHNTTHAKTSQAFLLRGRKEPAQSTCLPSSTGDHPFTAHANTTLGSKRTAAVPPGHRQGCA